VKDFERGNLWEMHQVSRSVGRPFEPEVLQESVALPEEVMWGKNLVDKDTMDLRTELGKSKVLPSL
jgi:hypothetical protein